MSALRIRSSEFVRVGGIDGEADARTDLDRQSVDLHRLGDFFDQAAADRARDRIVGRVFDDGHEFVAAIARPELAAAQDPRHPMRDRLQHQVADQMAVPVVDRLEPVEVDHEDRDLGPVAVGAADRGVQRFAERRAIGEPRQDVVHRERPDLPFRLDDGRLGFLQGGAEGAPERDCTGDREDQHQADGRHAALLDDDELLGDRRDHFVDEAGRPLAQRILVAGIGLTIEDRSRRRRVASLH